MVAGGKSVGSSSKFYQLLTDWENTEWYPENASFTLKDWVLKLFFLFFFVSLKIILGLGKCQILPHKVGLHCALVDHKFPKCLNIFFLSSRKRQTTVRSFKIKTSWSRDASSTANTIVSSQVRTNRHSFIHSSFNLFILYGLMQKFLLSLLPCKSKV